jgi:parallel beta-helix repeat protein
MKKIGLIVGMMSILAFTVGMGSVSRADEVVTLGMEIKQSVKIKAGTYRYGAGDTGILRVSGRSYVLDLAGVKLRGEGKNQGSGIVIRDARNVTIKNADVRGMKWGIVIERCVGVRLENCVASYNGNLPAGTIIDESGSQPEDQHGGGIVIRDSRNCRVIKCKAVWQWDGIDVVRSTGCIIEEGDFSYNNNWGVHFWDSSRNVFRRNTAVWCTTGASLLYQGTAGWQTYDAQAVAIDHNSHENLIEDNDLRFGGDGIFIRANEGALYPETGMMTPVRNGSHRNILRGNDCSYSPNNAIEVDFVDDTIIEGNNCSNSNYGLWLGYSRRAQVRGNLVLNCTRRGLEIENGQDGIIEDNVFSTQQAIVLRQNGRDKTPSGGYVIRRNSFEGDKQIALKDTGATIQDNLIIGGTMGLLVAAEGNSPVKEENTRHEERVDGVEIRALLDNYAYGANAGETIRLPLPEKAGKPAGRPIYVYGSAELIGKVNKKNQVSFRLPDERGYAPLEEEIRLFLCADNQRAAVKPFWLQVRTDLPRFTDRDGLREVKVGGQVRLGGKNLAGTKVLVNGVEVKAETVTTDKGIVREEEILFTLPAQFKAKTRVHVVLMKDKGEDRIVSAPFVLGVVP